MSSICKGIVLKTKKQCSLSATENGFCKRHVSQTFLEESFKNGNTVCRQFDRGCRNIIDEEDLSRNIKSCKECRIKISGKLKDCAHSGCTFKIKESDTYCGKHYRDYYYEKAKTEGIRYCDIERGCNSILASDETKCRKCYESFNELIANELKKEREKHALCLKCRINVKTKEYFCNICYDIVNRKNDLGRRKLIDVWRDFCKQAATRNQPVVITYDDFVELVIKPCFYCGAFYESKYNGIDRFDNTHGYTKNNVRPCCATCNIMKNDYDPELFYEKIKTIISFQTYGITNIHELVKKWSELQSISSNSFLSYKQTAITKRKLEFTIEKEDYEKFRNGQCYLCGIMSSDTHKNGIDRIDNSKGYIIKNCRSCCGHCNHMKLDMDYNTFILHCKQISKYNETNTKIELSVTDDTKDHIYSAAEIYYLLTTNQQTLYLDWAKSHGKSSIYVLDIQTLDLTKSKDDCIHEIKRFMEMERTRNYKLHHNEKPKHYSANSVYAMLMNNEHSVFVSWYEDTYGLSNSFHTQLDELISNLGSMSKEQGIEACRKFLKAETNRRKSSKAHELKCAIRSASKERSWKAKDITVDSTIPKNKIVMESTTTSVLPITDASKETESKEPKQWKSNYIYSFIKNDKAYMYKQYCEEHNEIKNTEVWETNWKTFEDKIKASDSYESVKEDIMSFIIELRKIRHDKLLEKTKVDILDRSDRSVWPKETVLKAWKNGKLNTYKEFLESTTSYELLVHRWEHLVSVLNSKIEDSELLNAIQKFQTNLRTAKYRNK